MAENFNHMGRAHKLYSLMGPESLDFATPLAFNAPGGRVPMGRSL